MSLLIPDIWLWFAIAFGIMLFATFIMGLQTKHLYTIDVVERKFTMMDLEFPATPQELVNIIGGLFLLPDAKKRDQAVKALKGQLLVDFFLFMPSTYGGIFLLSMKVATKMNGHFGQGLFSILAWLQALAFLLDIIENIYLWKKIKPIPQRSTPSVHQAYKLLEVFKWGIPLTASVCCFSSLLYFWITGLYSTNSYCYMLIIAAEMALFIIAGVIKAKRA